MKNQSLWIATLIFYFIISACGQNTITDAPNNGKQPKKTTGEGNRTGADGTNNTTPKPSTNTGSTTPLPTIPSSKPTIPSTTTNPPVMPPPQNVECYKASAFVCKIEKLITDMTNQYRTQSGLSPVTHDPKISFVSRDWSNSQAISRSIGHSGFPRARVALYQNEFGIRTSLAAENVAMTGRVGSGSETDQAATAIAKEFATMWWNSYGHRRNMLGRNYKLLGVGIVNRGSGWYATQIFK